MGGINSNTINRSYIHGVYNGNITQISSKKYLPTLLFTKPIDSFSGREQDIDNLCEIFETTNKKIALHGSSGIGKTETARKLAIDLRSRDIINKIFWLEITRKENISKSLKKTGKIRKIRYKQEQLIKSTYENFKQTKCLFIFDNGTCRQDIAQFEPIDEITNFYFLVTSQQDYWGTGFTNYKLTKFDRNSTLQLFKNILNNYYKPEDEKYYLELAEMVAYIPLGLQVILCNLRPIIEISEAPFNYSKYITEIRCNKSYIHWNNNALYDMICKSLDNISYYYTETMLNNLALDVIYVCSFLSTEYIDMEVIFIILSSRDKNIDKTNITQAVNLLEKYQLLYTQDDKIIIESLVKNILKLKQQIDTLHYYYEMCLLTVLYNDIPEAHTKSIMLCADENVETVLKLLCLLFTKYEKFEYFFNLLVKYSCIKCLEALFNENDTKDKETKLTNNEYFNQGENSFISGQHTALHFAAHYWNMGAINFLTKYNNISVNVKNTYGDIPLFTMVKNQFYSHNVNWKNILKNFKYNNCITDADKNTLLHVACKTYRIELIEILLTNYRADPNQINAYNETALHVFLHEIYKGKPDSNEQKEQLKILNIFAQKGASFNLKENNGYTTIHNLLVYIKQHNLHEFLYYVLHEIKVNLIKEHMVVLKDTIFEPFIEYCNYVNKIDENGNNSLFLFVLNSTEDYKDWNTILLTLRFHKFMTNEKNETLLHIAANKKFYNLKRELVNSYSMTKDLEDNSSGLYSILKIYIFLFLLYILYLAIN